MVLKNLTCPQLSGVAAVHFCGWEKRLFPCSASVGDFFKGLTSLHHLYTDDNALECLMQVQENMEIASQPNVILPSLSVVCLELSYSSLSDIHVKPETAAFFLSRLQCGHPVSNLNLSLRNSKGFDNMPNVDALKEVRGLNMTYKLKSTSNISS